MVSIIASTFHNVLFNCCVNEKEDKKKIYEYIVKCLDLNQKQRLEELANDELTIKIYQKSFTEIDNFRFWNLGLERISRLSLTLFKELDFSLKQVISLHLCINAFYKLELQSRLHNQLLGIEESNHQIEYRRIDFKNDFIPDKEKTFNARQIYHFFSFNEYQWSRYCGLMQQEDHLEQMGYFFSITPFNFLNVYEMMFFKQVEGFVSIIDQRQNLNKEGFNSDLIFVPSFSMLQNALIVKTESLQPLSSSFIPLFEETSDEIKQGLKLENNFPLCLHFPLQSLLQGFSEESQLFKISSTSIKELGVIKDFDSILESIEIRPLYQFEKYDEIIKDLNKNSEIVRNQENYKLKIVGCKTKVLKVFSAFIENCEIETLIVLGDVYIQNSKINSIISKRNVFIRECEINSIEAKVNLVFEMSSVEGVKKANTIYAISPKEHQQAIIDYTIQEEIECKTFVTSINTDRIYIASDNHIGQIEFTRNSRENEENQVIVKEGYQFNGTVKKGQLINENEINQLEDI